MPFNIEAAIWYLFLLDSLVYNLIVWLNLKEIKKDYNKNFRTFSRLFPLTKGYAMLYLFLVLWVGFTLLRIGVLPW
tara:strand:+ start:2679 stop:2906 length:228 start_codon:yes stop_codon:yes gene_type:complete